MAEEAVRRLDIAVCDKLADICGADDAPVDPERRDNVAADAVLRTVVLEAGGSPLTLIAEAEVMPHDYPRDAKLLYE